MALSGQTPVTIAGAAEALGSQRICASLMIKALTTNTGLAYVGNDGAGDVSSNLPALALSSIEGFHPSNVFHSSFDRIPAELSEFCQ